MGKLTPNTPGVYVNEIDSFGNSIIPVATAVPAFIGYTPQASYEGKSYYSKPTKITSFAEFKAIFMLPDPESPAAPAKQYCPEYYFVEQSEQPTKGDFVNINGKYYSILPDPNSIYYLYNSIRLFFQNGGGDAYIVSVGTYGKTSGKPLADPSEKIVNPNVSLNELLEGIALLKNEQEPTMYICPEATLLSVADNRTLMESMLLQAEGMQTAVCLFDVIGGLNPDPDSFMDDIKKFRESTGNQGLNYGVSYYPFIGTTIMQNSDIDYTNIFGGDLKKLASLINSEENPNSNVAKILDMIENPPTSPLTVSQYQNAMINASSVYSKMVKHVLETANILPPSGAMAGVYTVNDNTRGVWNSPANISIVGANSLPIKISDSQQANLNIDQQSGKSINSIRFFNGQGILVWGARTLDGNSLDWKYVSVRRTMIFLEQSVKLAARAYVFAPNDANTWTSVTSMISSFLTNVWKEGGLQGAKPTDAFQVNVGLGSTMTSEDILQGIMRVSVKVAVVHPAEFIIISFEQQQAVSG